MHGDFSRWFPKIPVNQTGILHQQGRVLLEADVNAQTLLVTRWQDLAGRSAFGADVAAIPSDAPLGFKVVKAQLGGSPAQVTIDVQPGVAWADGLLVELPGTPGTAVSFTATPIGPPLQAVPCDPGAAGKRDAVILEVWRRALNGFQSPADLIEPALGGPDTAERMETAYAFRLFRLAEGEDCATIRSRLHDDWSRRGRLHATLQPTTTSSGDCPVIQGGGYTGFEHDLFRVEIADVDAGGPMFKWSRWNGGLVGRGRYDAVSKKITLAGNDQAILRSGLASFYLEVLVNDAALGGWRVAYGAKASLGSDGEIDLSGPKSFGTLPAAGAPWFFRLWNDLRAVNEFPPGAATDLIDGIRLELDAPAGTDYLPGDYWTFPVRAGGLDNAAPLLDHAPPQGIHRHRVPLAELTWPTAGPIVSNGGIQDCRIPLHPVTARDGCCTVTVGDGVTSHGDFRTVQDAIEHLPDDGGRVCIFPGEYHENVVISGKVDVELLGCGDRSKIISKPSGEELVAADPVIHVLDSSNVAIRSLQIIADASGIGLLFEADDQAGTTNVDGGAVTPDLEDLFAEDLLVQASFGSGIEVRDGARVTIRRNRVLIKGDAANDWAGITLWAQNALVEKNLIQVTGNAKELTALGGIWLRGGCNLVRVVDNDIIGGIGHGVMLGHAERAATGPGTVGMVMMTVNKSWSGYIFHNYLADDCVGCGPGTVTVPPAGTPGSDGSPTWVAGDPLLHISIEGNRISAMGLSGIGVFGFFGQDDSRGVIFIDGLDIIGNHISSCVDRFLALPDKDQAVLMGFGAVSLGDVDRLVVRDNLIERNGNNSNGPVCGVYALNADGAELSRNRIVGNGQLGLAHVPPSLAHGGIWLGHVRPPLGTGYGSPRGIMAAQVRENEVHALNGPALFIEGIGHMQVVANALSTISTLGVDGYAVARIRNHSVASAIAPSNPTHVGLRFGTAKMKKTNGKVLTATGIKSDKKLSAAELMGAAIEADAVKQPGWAMLSPHGGVLFADNHCVVEVQTQDEQTMTLGIDCLDHIGFHDNHCVLVQARGSWVSVILRGGTVEASGNRLEETCLVLASGYFTGLAALATSNVSDHCLVVQGQSTNAVAAANVELDRTFCQDTVVLGYGYGGGGK